MDFSPIKTLPPLRHGHSVSGGNRQGLCYWARSNIGYKYLYWHLVSAPPACGTPSFRRGAGASLLPPQPRPGAAHSHSTGRQGAPTTAASRGHCGEATRTGRGEGRPPTRAGLQATRAGAGARDYKQRPSYLPPLTAPSPRDTVHAPCHPRHIARVAPARVATW